MMTMATWKMLLALTWPHRLIRDAGARLSVDRNEWMQVSDNVAFQRNAELTMDGSMSEHATDEAIKRMLGDSSSSTSRETNPSYLYQPYSSAVEYNQYELAWHLLGYYVDCATEHDGAGCTRQVLYAVYANPAYEGGGIGEYAYYNKNADTWYCYDNDSCAMKMDCHLPDTQWKLLGVFKIDNISQDNGWMEQLFKHQGVCIWGEDTYKTASKMREKIPKECTKTKQTLEDGSYLYYDAKPAANANITLGLYTDYTCSKEYVGNETYDVFSLAGSDESYWVSFNEALDVYKQCQPCVAYDLTYSGFDCYDQAGYTNCNQCMKFSAKAGCKVASKSDVMSAARQNGIISFDANGATYGSGGVSRTYGESSTWESSEMTIGVSIESSAFEFPLLTASFICFCIGLVAFAEATVYKTSRLKRMENSKSLLDGDSGPTGPFALMGTAVSHLAYKVMHASFGNDSHAAGTASTPDKTLSRTKSTSSVQSVAASTRSKKSIYSNKSVAASAGIKKSTNSIKSVGSKVINKISASLSNIENVKVENKSIDVKPVIATSIEPVGSEVMNKIAASFSNIENVKVENKSIDTEPIIANKSTSPFKSAVSKAMKKISVSLSYIKRVMIENKSIDTEPNIIGADLDYARLESKDYGIVHNTCIHVHNTLNALDGEEGAASVNGIDVACMTVGESIHHIGEGYYKHLHTC